MRRGVQLAVDVGRVRVGLARCDADGLIATPLRTLQRRGGPASLVGPILAAAEEVDATEVVVGLPISLRGTDTPSTADARAVAQAVADADRLPVRLVDERLTTVSAAGALRAAGRDTRTARSVIDQMAAVILLQYALDAERGGGAPAGALVAPNRE